jgi:hypothetical protein
MLIRVSLAELRSWSSKQQERDRPQAQGLCGSEQMYRTGGHVGTTMTEKVTAGKVISRDGRPQRRLLLALKTVVRIIPGVRLIFTLAGKRVTCAGVVEHDGNITIMLRCLQSVM